MATVKNYLGFTECNGLTNFDINSLGERLSSLSNLSDYHNNLVPKPNLQDLVIQKSNIILSFALSRNLLDPIYKNPVVYVTITGNNYKQEKETIRLYKGGQPGNNDIAIKWDNIYYGILRVGITAEQVSNIVKTFNTISAVGVIIFDSKRDEPFGKLFQLGTQTISDSDFLKICNKIEEGSGDFDKKPASDFLEKTTINRLSQITRYEDEPASSSYTINNDIIIKPYYLSIDYDMVGYGKEDTDAFDYTNPSFFYEKVGFTLKTITHFNTTLEPICYQFCSRKEFAEYNKQGDNGKVLPDNWSNVIKNELDELSFTISDFYPIYETEKFIGSQDKNVKFFGLVYGGYTYLRTNYFNKLRHCDEVFAVKTEELLSKYYTFDGERVNRKFISYDGPDKINYYNYYIDGTFSYIHDIKDFPFEGFLTDGGTAKVQHSQTGVLTKDGFTAGDGWLTNEDFSCRNLIQKDDFFYATNKFTRETSTKWFNFALISDDVQYWKIGEKIEKNGAALPNDIQEDIICYNDETIKIEKGSFVNVWAETFSKAIEGTNLVCLDSWTPQLSATRPSLNKEFTNTEKNTDPNGSFFKYVFMGDKEEEYRKYYDLPCYTILYSKTLPKETIYLDDATSNYLDTSVSKFQENKLFFKFKSPIGDLNNKYTGNQFISYAINYDRSIGISQKGRIENISINVCGKNSSGNSFNITHSLNSNENNKNWKDLLELLYTEKTNVLDFTNLNLEIDDLTKCTELIFTFKFYSKDGRLLLTIANKNAITPITGIRPLGLRKNGIIINPIEPNEDLTMENIEEKVAQRVNAKTYEYGTNTIRGTILQGRAVTAEGAPFEKSTLKPLIEYEEQLNGRSGFDGSGGYLFDGINLQELQKQTVDESNVDSLINKINGLNTTIGNASSGLIKQINDNNYAINSQIKPYLQGLGVHHLFKDVYRNNSNENFNSTNLGVLNYGDGWVKEVTFSQNITGNSICIPQCEVVYKSGGSITDNQFASQINCTILNLSQTANSYTVKFSTSCPTNTNNYEWIVKVHLYVINLPTFTATTSAVQTFNSPPPTVIETIEEEIIEEVIEETLTEQTEVVEPETTSDGESTE